MSRPSIAPFIVRLWCTMRVRIRHSEIGELAHQAESVRIFAAGEIPVLSGHRPNRLKDLTKKRNYESGSVFCVIGTVIGGIERKGKKHDTESFCAFRWSAFA